MTSEIALHAPFDGWVGPLDAVPDPVFGQGMMGAGLAVEPLEGIVRAPADGEIVSVPDSAHAVTMRLANGAELLIHIGLETVGLKGQGFTARVAAGDRVARGDTLIVFDMEAVARGAADLVTPIVLPGEGVALRIGETGRRVASGDIIAHIGGEAVTTAPVAEGPAVHRDIAVTAPHGIHARPAARIVAMLKPYDAQVTLTHGERSANARSTVALLALGARAGDTIVAEARGTDAATALDALAAFAAEAFGDSAEDAPAAPIAAPEKGGGVCASPGLAIGQIHQFRFGAISVPEEGVGVAQESAQLDAAIRAVANDLATHGAGSAIVEAHRAILEDPQLHADASAAIAQGKSAGFAWRAATRTAAAALTATGDPRLAERVADLHDLERQMLLQLGGEGEAPSTQLPTDAILVANDLLPSQFLSLDKARLAGICTAAGGPTAHVAILAAAAGIPMVVAAGSSVLDHADGTPAILDAGAGSLSVDPGDTALSAAAARRAELREARAAEVREAQSPAQTSDGTRIEVFANLGSVADAAEAVRTGAEGCGLLRTEFLFLDRDTAPDEGEQTSCYRAIATSLGDRPLIVRTLDIGGDKPVSYLPRAAEENPALGMRGIRFSLARPDLFITQLRAILTAVPAGQCRIMLPMVADVGELLTARRALDEAMAAVGRTDGVELGIMVETPAAALLADQLARHADFLSIGTNDLTQYALAADRGNAGVSAMVDAWHPAVLRLVSATVAGASRHGRWVGMCGGLASDPRAAPILIGLGVTELSAVPSAVPAVKAAVRRTDMHAARALAERALDAESPAAVRALVETA